VDVEEVLASAALSCMNICLTFSEAHNATADVEATNVVLELIRRVFYKEEN
jgi:hypothetical protein